MPSKEGCEKALARIVNDDYYFENDPYGEDKASAFDKDVDMIEQLIEEHFKPKENIEEYKHFKLHSDSTLKNLTKVELIDYIKMLYHNWGVCDEQLKRIIDKAKELSDSNDELRRQLYFCEPYKFEDLKPNMWVWDDLIKKCVQLDEDCFEPNNVILILMHGNYGYRESTRTFFEENRFFPVQYANLIKMEVKNDDCLCNKE